MFLHVTTRIEGRKDDDLLGRVGGRGFPSFFILEGDGSVVGQVRGTRNVKSFAKAIDDGKEFVELRKKAQSGDKAAQVDFLLARARIGQVDIEKLQQEAEKLEMTPAQEAEYKGLVANTMMNRERTRAVGEAFLAMEKKGFVPADPWSRPSFYYSIFMHAEQAKNLELMERCAAEVEKGWGGEARMKGVLTRIRGQIRKLKEEDKKG